MNITLVLDPHALCEYARLSMHVAEMLAVVAEEEATAGVPALALLEATRSYLAVDEAQRLQRLVDGASDRPVAPLDLTTKDVESVAAIVSTWQCSLGLAHALHETRVRNGNAYLLTGEPDLASKILGRHFSVLSTTPAGIFRF